MYTVLYTRPIDLDVKIPCCLEICAYSELLLDQYCLFRFDKLQLMSINTINTCIMYVDLVLKNTLTFYHQIL
jgi:hypothetical protein